MLLALDLTFSLAEELFGDTMVTRSPFDSDLLEEAELDCFAEDGDDTGIEEEETLTLLTEGEEDRLFLEEEEVAALL